MALTSPERRDWWNEPLHAMELIWIALAFVWGLFMFGFMVYWHLVGQQNLSNETYRVDPQAYAAKTETMIAQFKVRDEAFVPVVKPPPGSDVYLLARLWEWYPMLELQAGQTYRLHLSSLDWQHGFSLQPININISVHPKLEHVVTITPTSTGEFTIVCNEFCGVGHHTMVGKIFIVP